MVDEALCEERIQECHPKHSVGDTPISMADEAIP